MSEAWVVSVTRPGARVRAPNLLVEQTKAAIALDLDGKKVRAARCYEQVLRSLRTQPDEVVSVVARILRKRKRHGQAATAIRHALRRAPEKSSLWCELGWALREGRRHDKALTAFQTALCLDPSYLPALQAVAQMATPGPGPEDDERRALLRCLACAVDVPTAHLRLAAKALPGPNYLSALDCAHRMLAPASYLEIGVASGASLALARRPTRVVGVDPNPLVRRRLPVPATIYRMSSDRFFREVDVRSLLGERGLGLGFIDGLHTFEQTLCDFLNLEALADAESVLILHDCVPLDERTSALPRRTSFWSGDSWRIVPLLLEQRPDLRLSLVPSPPTGLLVVTNLNTMAARRLYAPKDLERYLQMTVLEFNRMYLDRVPRVVNERGAHRRFFEGIRRKRWLS